MQSIAAFFRTIGKAEPILVSGFVAAVLAFSVEFGIYQFTDRQENAIQGLIAAAFLFVARRNVASPGTLEDAGTSLGEVARVSKNPDVHLEAMVTPGRRR